MSLITREQANIFRITHLDNLPWVLAKGIHCRNAKTRDSKFHEIGNADLIDKRAQRAVPIAPHGTLSDYVPFYFTPYSPMLYNIKTGYGGMKKTLMQDIVILVSDLHKISGAGLTFVFTDQHAYPVSAKFYSTLDGLKFVDWDILVNRDFKRDPEDPKKMERYMAEALIYQHVPLSALGGIVCYNPAVEKRVNAMQSQAGTSMPTAVKPKWYF
jgi:hypothetical protein